MATQIIVMTSDHTQNRVLPGFAFLFNKYFSDSQPVTVCGFSQPKILLPGNFSFHSIGNFAFYPANRWSDALKIVLDTVAEEHFILMLDDYYIFRQVDTRAFPILHDYMRQFRYVMKIDLTVDRLYADPGKYHYGFNNYGTAGYLDLIHSLPGSDYQMSLWGGMWNRDLMQKFVIPGETAQQLEMRGTTRVNEAGSSVVVLGTRQAPLIHGNVIFSGRPGEIVRDIGGWQLQPSDEAEMRSQGIMPTP